MSRTSRTTVALGVAALALAGLSACGSEASDAEDAAAENSAETSTDDEEATGVVVSDGWVRATEGTEDPSMSAAFMSLENDGDAVRLTGASTDVAGMTQIHEMVMGDDGAMVMQELGDGLDLPTGAHEHLEPGGNHVMLMDLQEELEPGDEVDLTLEFSDGSQEALTLPVKEFSEEEGDYEHSHSDN